MHHICNEQSTALASEGRRRSLKSQWMEKESAPMDGVRRPSRHTKFRANHPRDRGSFMFSWKMAVKLAYVTVCVIAKKLWERLEGKTLSTPEQCASKPLFTLSAVFPDIFRDRLMYHIKDHS